MNSIGTGQIENDFLALPQAERRIIINYGAAFLLADLRKRLFFAESKVRFYEDKHGISLEHLDSEGLPDDAGVELHEDYIMWHHWTRVAQQVRKEARSLQGLVEPAQTGGLEGAGI